MSMLIARQLKFLPRLPRPKIGQQQLMAALLSARDLLLQGSRRLPIRLLGRLRLPWAVGIARRSVGWIGNRVNIVPVIRLSNYGSIIALLPMLLPTVLRWSQKLARFTTSTASRIRTAIRHRFFNRSEAIPPVENVVVAPRTEVKVPRSHRASQPITRESLTTPKIASMTRDYPAKKTAHLNHR